jgi:hypothetical protein
MVRFAWHSELHNLAGLIVLGVGALIYAGGSVVMARPYVSQLATLFIAVPIAAVVGMLLLGPPFWRPVSQRPASRLGPVVARF